LLDNANFDGKIFFLLFLRWSLVSMWVETRDRRGWGLLLQHEACPVATLALGLSVAVNITVIIHL
jgi:hypothetical protein